MPTEMEELLVRVAEFQRTRHFGKYRGVVSDNDDPDGSLRIRALVPAVYGEAESPWAMPSVPFAGPQHGLALLPEVGDGVWVEFEGGDISRPIWTGCWWAGGQLPLAQGELKKRILATSAGHEIVVDEDADVITVTHGSGPALTIGASEITLKCGNCDITITGTEIKLNGGMVKVTTSGASLVNDAFKVGA